MTTFSAERHEIERLRSVAHLFPVSKGRRGLYRLNFANGEFYVGQTDNLVARLSAHRRRWPDITSVEFTRFAAGAGLNEPEQRWIHAEQHAGRVLRNIRHAEGPVVGESDFDIEILPANQHLAWLNTDVWPSGDLIRTESPGQRAKTQARYDSFIRSPLAEPAISVLREYVQNCIPCPVATELTFWSVSAAPSTNKASWPRLATVCINSMETLVLGHALDQPLRAWGFINVSRETAHGLETRQFRRMHPNLVVGGGRPYDASGPDVVALHFDDARGLVQLLQDRTFAIREAARRLNLRAMRKGPTMQWRSHCPALADHLL